MPNHVTIEMTVSGDREAIMEFAESHFVANTNPDRNAWEDECFFEFSTICLLYTSDAADDLLQV